MVTRVTKSSLDESCERNSAHSSTQLPVFHTSWFVMDEAFVGMGTFLRAPASRMAWLG